MFTEISMTNFKSWRETGPVRMAPLTAFFGANSSGKSSLLQMLLLLKQTAESNDRGLVLKTGSMQPGYVNLGTAQEIVHRDETEMSLGFGWRLPKSPPLVIPVPRSERFVTLEALEFETVIRATRKKIEVKSLRYRRGEDFEVKLHPLGRVAGVVELRVDGVSPRRQRGRPYETLPAKKCYGFPREALTYFTDTLYLQNLEFAFEEKLESLYYLGPLRVGPQRAYSWAGEQPTDVGQSGELAIHALLAGKNEAVDCDAGLRPGMLLPSVAKWLSRLDIAASLDLRSVGEGSNLYEVLLKRHDDAWEVLLSDVGIGVSQVLPVLVLCYYVPEGSTIILEQPELHLHPSVQAGLADVIIHAIQKRNVQIIVESHSEHLLRRLQRRIAEEVICLDDTALYFCEMREGESKLRPLDIDIYGNIHHWPRDFFGDLAGEMVAAFDAGLERQAV